MPTLTVTGTGKATRVPCDKAQSGGFIHPDPKVAFGPGGGQLSPDPTIAETQASSITVIP